jgi:hypothetical protein
LADEKSMTAHRGRPLGSTRIAEPSGTVSIWLPARERNRLMKVANGRNETIGATIRLVRDARRLE